MQKERNKIKSNLNKHKNASTDAQTRKSTQQVVSTIRIKHATNVTTRKTTLNPISNTPRQAWRTPNAFYAMLDWEFRFDLDAAASTYDTKCADFFDAQLNALHILQWAHPETYCTRVFGKEHKIKNVQYETFQRVFCNPGFANLLPWYEKAYEQVSLPPMQRCEVVVMLGLNGSSKAMQFAERYATEIREILPRINFDVPIDPSTDLPYENIKQSSNAHNNVVCVFRPPMQKQFAHAPLARKFIWQWKEKHCDTK